MEIRTCSRCGRKIPRGRIDALPSATTCAEHSDARAKTDRDVQLDGADVQDMVRLAMTPARGGGDK